ncbi:family 78 glycoside hydrolase catalytic domain [Kribbella sp. NPDC002412]
MTNRPEAQWIGNPHWESAAHPEALPVFRTTFLGPARSAKLCLTAIGVYDATLNGSPIGAAVLEPPYTDFARRVVYREYDVTALLHDGENTLVVEVGPGMAHIPPTPGRYQKLTRSDGPPRLLAHLELDGTPHPLAWETALGRTTFSTWYGGEDYDARRSLEWQPAAKSNSGPAISTSTAPAVQIVETLTTQAITEPKPGVYVFDLGLNFAGWQQLQVQGPPGTAIVMRPGEVLDKAGLVIQDLDGTGGPIWDTYTLAGHGTETWHPRFRYHGLRYLQVEGLPQPPTSDTVTGLVLRAANEKVGHFACSNELITTLHTIIDRAIQSNMFSVLTDCPHREKLGWLEQIHLVFGPIAFGYDVADYYRELLKVIAEAQTEDGLVPDIAPEYTVFEDGFRDDPNWGSAIVLVPWLLYREYGDTDTLREHYPAMIRYVDYLTSKANGHLLDHGLGDWAAFDESTPKGVTASFGYLRAVDTLHQIATVLGEQADAATFKDLGTQIAAAFQAAFYHPHDHTYGVANQACHALALELGVVPAEARQAVLNQLVADIVAQGNHLTVGEIGLGSVLRVLADAGRHDVIWDVVTKPGYPGYGHLTTGGTTALPEYWDGPDGHGSQNHFMLGVVDDWFTRHLAGLQDEVIRPVVVGDLTWAEAERRTKAGLLRSAWRLDGDRFELEVTVPAGGTAVVHVPLSGEHDHITAPEDAEPLGEARFRVGAGVWRFSREGGQS